MAEAIITAAKEDLRSKKSIKLHGGRSGIDDQVRQPQDVHQETSVHIKCETNEFFKLTRIVK